MHKREKQTVVIADYDYGNVDIERAIIEGAGLELVTAPSFARRRRARGKDARVA